MTEADKERLAKLMEEKAREWGQDSDAIEDRDAKLSFMTKMYTYLQAAALIREQPAEPAWIAVEDRLPEVEGKVLVHCRSADPDSPLITTAWYHPEEGEWTLMASYWIPAISHWMPLPPPPA
jgi:hypothetical protein